MVIHRIRVCVSASPPIVLRNTAKNIRFKDPCSTKGHRPTTSPVAEIVVGYVLSVHVELARSFAVDPAKVTVKPCLSYT